MKKMRKGEAKQKQKTYLERNNLKLYDSGQEKSETTQL